jgi:hypothetical protein
MKKEKVYSYNANKIPPFSSHESVPLNEGPRVCRMERVWDEADYVVPPAENGAFFVTTNIIVTPNQTWGSCPEVRRLRQTKPGAAVQR